MLKQTKSTPPILCVQLALLFITHADTLLQATLTSLMSLVNTHYMPSFCCALLLKLFSPAHAGYTDITVSLVNTHNVSPSLRCALQAALSRACRLHRHHCGPGEHALRVHAHSHHHPGPQEGQPIWEKMEQARDCHQPAASGLRAVCV